MGIEIKAAQSQDYEMIKRSCLNEGWLNFDRADYDAALQQSVTAIAVQDGHFLGFIRALTDGHFTLFVCELLVLPAHRRKGIGSALMDYVQGLYPSARVDLISDADEFYKAGSFRVIGSGMRKSSS